MLNWKYNPVRFRVTEWKNNVLVGKYNYDKCPCISFIILENQDEYFSFVFMNCLIVSAPVYPCQITCPANMISRERKKRMSVTLDKRYIKIQSMCKFNLQILGRGIGNISPYRSCIGPVSKVRKYYKILFCFSFVWSSRYKRVTDAAGLRLTTLIYIFFAFTFLQKLTVEMQNGTHKECVFHPVKYAYLFACTVGFPFNYLMLLPKTRSKCQLWMHFSCPCCLNWLPNVITISKKMIAMRTHRNASSTQDYS